MAGRVEGKVAFITGAARGQGRSHALRLAQEGADIIAVDLPAPVDTAPYPLADAADLDQTVSEVQNLGRRVFAAEADVRDFAALKAAVDKGVAELGRLDAVVANAGILSFGRLDAMPEQNWQDMIDINLTGVWHTAKAAIPHLKAGGRGGSIIMISSVAGLKGSRNVGHYVTAKHGVVGLMRALTVELAEDQIRVNTVHPTNVDTGMIQNPAAYAVFAPDLAPEERTKDVIAKRFLDMGFPMGVPWIESVDVSNAVLWLASDEARYVTGVTMPIDAGLLTK